MNKSTKIVKIIIENESIFLVCKKTFDTALYAFSKINVRMRKNFEIFKLYNGNFDKFKIHNRRLCQISN